MESKYNYFKRDISWLSFNYRVLLEATDEHLPLYERINFISIYSSNLEEFYKIRVADHKAVASGATESDEETVQSARELVEEINREVTRQLDDRVHIYEQKILPALRRNHIIFYQDRHVEPFHQQFIKDFFREEIFPYLQPVPVSKDKIVSFLRDNRLYLAIRVYPKKENETEQRQQPYYFVMKQPYAKVPRFIELPAHEKDHYLMFTEDIIKANLNLIFPGYDVDSSYCIKISRDADILIDDTASSADLVAQLKKKVKKRKIGDVCRFVYDRAMPQDFLDFLVDAFRIQRDELVPGDKHLNLEDLRHLPNPNKSLHSLEKPKPMKLTVLDEKESIFNYVARKDLLLYYPYHSFEHFIHFLYEAVHNPETREIMVTQYRVAENSAVINTLIAAAQNGKKVTVFVELKARFDEENNLATAEMMQAAGIKIIYSIPGLKVHAKVALVRRRGQNGEKLPSYAYISTGNFNEKTATLYADCGLFTCRKMEDFLKFLLIAGVILVGIFKEVNKNSKSKKAKNNRPVPPTPSPVEVAPDATPMPEAWGRPRSLEELFQPIPAEQRTRKPKVRQQESKPKKKKEEVSVAASIANSAAQDERNSRQGAHYNTSHDSHDNKEDFTIHSAEEARRAIIWGEILQRKY